MHRLLTVVGWPYLALAAVMLVAAAPTVLTWWRFEMRLARTLTARPREGWPYW